MKILIPVVIKVMHCCEILHKPILFQQEAWTLMQPREVHHVLVASENGHVNLLARSFLEILR